MTSKKTRASRKVSRENLSSTQKKVKQPRRCIYDGENKNTDPELARDILSLYITCELGYSPIRHLVGLNSDKKIEDTIRQHMLGRKGVDGSIGELYCPGSTCLPEEAKEVVSSIARKYKTKEDPYVKELLLTGKWKDDPIKATKKVCDHCGKELEKDWKVCPFCGTRKESGRQKSLF